MMTKHSIGVLLLVAVAVSAGCSGGQAGEPDKATSQQPSSLPESAPALQAAAQTTAPVAAPTQLAGFEWHGIHNGMSVPEFKAKFGPYTCASKTCTAIYIQTMVSFQEDPTIRDSREQAGQIYRIQVLCDGLKGCEEVSDAVMAHFGTGKVRDVKRLARDRSQLPHGPERVVEWSSQNEVAQYHPSLFPTAGIPDVVVVCNPVIAEGRCNLW
jgi:hypothetical protein